MPRNMFLPKTLSALLLASATSLTFGGILLYIYALVPLVLVETTLAAVIVLFILSYFVSKGNIVSINIATILGVVAPILSYFTPAHVGVLEQIGTGDLISLLGVLQILGFYLFPILYLILRIVFNGKLKQLAKSPQAVVKS
ncbi:MAG TPA: hypothetical protein VN739_03185 [Nitrososphaerales archaeon]|nr:hypothetical protein [Nitrososphaerales archaeon]